ncbi:hypothetical protein HRW18_04285 [Streptomyces lunaelactis]|uniref:hypothetical protein n=1 Tax=Streptomyces lunaelactis TaxID=1535768 RepID=UPI001584F883|nr:hypothetical protein [Streptomyces lunaelactis]NUK07244.1 hypothetical protein [Streptomyces lunaelactis]NUK38160.1 hypothetical protein [Streptomyces lunaelactis]NUK45132.1 hypothetical protein [Streptomyces lunaelactis]NUK61251.1 hypothetical protein [Streptomyces lunaelactis]NUK96627.1 hypothetical protein [Streptomyces lunaelactis]
MARHTAPQSRRPALLRAGLTVAAVAAALGAGEAAAHAVPTAPVGPDALGAGTAQGLTGPVTNSVTGVGQLKSLQLNPLAKTGVDPLTNGVATQVADFKPVSTEAATGPLADGAALEDLPVVGGV